MHTISQNIPTMRVASENDRQSLERLAAMNDQAPLTGSVLIAETDQAVVAAFSLTGRGMSDPWSLSGKWVGVLEGMAKSLQRQGLLQSHEGH